MAYKRGGVRALITAGRCAPRNYPSFRWLQFGGRLVAVLRPSIDESFIEEDHFITMIALLEPKLASVLG